jgi:hypothetical protein
VIFVPAGRGMRASCDEADLPRGRCSLTLPTPRHAPPPAMYARAGDAIIVI